MTARLTDLSELIAQCTDSGVVLSARIERLVLAGCEHQEIRRAIDYQCDRKTWERQWAANCLTLTPAELWWLGELEAAMKVKGEA